MLCLSVDSREIFRGGRMAFAQHFFSLNLLGFEEMSFVEISRYKKWIRTMDPTLLGDLFS